LPVIGRETGGEHAAVDGDTIGGTEVREGCSSISSEYAVDKNGWRKSGGRDLEKVVCGKCQF